MYCSNCGNKNDGGTFCVKCGSRIEYVNNNVNNNNNRSESNGLSVASIVLGVIGLILCFTFILSPISLIITIIGLILGIFASKKVKNIIGIVLNSIGLFISLVMLFLMVLIFNLIIALPEDYYYEEGFERFPDEYIEEGHREYY